MRSTGGAASPRCIVPQMEPRLARFDAIAAERSVGAGPAHDHLHVRRVAANARLLSRAEGAREEVAVAAALLHELFNYPKDHPDSARSGEVCAEHAREVMRAEGCAPTFVTDVAYAIEVHPFSRGLVPETLEGKVLQDADRLDALGAIGIARCFASCAEMKRPFYCDDDPFCGTRVPDDKAWGLDHFYRKLLRVPETLHTATAKRLADERVVFVRSYLEQLGRELGQGCVPEDGLDDADRVRLHSALDEADDELRAGKGIPGANVIQALRRGEL
jgi:uncharacterized protein